MRETCKQYGQRERDSIFLGELIRCGFMTLHSLITSGSQYWCLGFRSVEGSEEESLVWRYSDSWPVKFMAGASLWREAVLSALQLAMFVIDGMAANHCDSWAIIFMTRATLSFQGKRPGTALNYTWLWLMAWEDKWWVGAWDQCCAEKSI